MYRKVKIRIKLCGFGSNVQQIALHIIYSTLVSILKPYQHTYEIFSDQISNKINVKKNCYDVIFL